MGPRGCGLRLLRATGQGKAGHLPQGTAGEVHGDVQFASQAEATGHFILVFRPRNVDKHIRSLKEKGVKPIGCVMDQPSWGIRVVYFRDQDGNPIEVHSPLPKRKWSKELLERTAKYSDK